MMGYVMRGVAMITGHPRLWRYVWKPMIAGLFVFAAAVFLGWWLIVPHISGLISLLGLQGFWASAIGTAAYAIALVFLSGTLYLALAGLLSSLLWDRLSAEVERELGREPPRARLSMASLVWDILLRAAFSSVIAVLAFVLGWSCLGIVAFLLAGWLGLYDYTSCAFLRRGWTFPGQFFRAFSCNGWPGFALGSGILTLIPLVNVLMLPSLVAGGTLMVLDSEKRISGS